LVWLGLVVVPALFAGANPWVVLLFCLLVRDADPVVLPPLLAALSSASVLSVLCAVVGMLASARVVATPVVAMVADAIRTPRAILVLVRAGELIGTPLLAAVGMSMTLPLPAVDHLSVGPSTS
jgi:hypothetical protein